VINFGSAKRNLHIRRFLGFPLSGLDDAAIPLRPALDDGEYWPAGTTPGAVSTPILMPTTRKEMTGCWLKGIRSIFTCFTENNFGFHEWRQLWEDGYLPLVTSYDYDAALDERADPPGSFYLFRMYSTSTGLSRLPLPAALPMAGCRNFSSRNRLRYGAICRLRQRRSSSARWKPWPELWIHFSKPKELARPGAGPLVATM